VGPAAGESCPQQWTCLGQVPGVSPTTVKVKVSAAVPNNGSFEHGMDALTGLVQACRTTWLNNQIAHSRDATRAAGVEERTATDVVCHIGRHLALEQNQLCVEAGRDLARLFVSDPKAWAYQQNTIPLQVGDVVAFRLKPLPRKETTGGARHAGRGRGGLASADCEAMSSRWFWQVCDLLPLELHTASSAAGLARLQGRARLVLGLASAFDTDGTAAAGYAAPAGDTTRPWLYPAELAGLVAAALEAPAAGTSSLAPFLAAGAAMGPLGAACATADGVRLTSDQAVLLALACRCMGLATPPGLMEQLREALPTVGAALLTGGGHFDGLKSINGPPGCINAYAAVLAASNFFPAFGGLIAVANAQQMRQLRDRSAVGTLAEELGTLRVSAASTVPSRPAMDATPFSRSGAISLSTGAIVDTLVHIAHEVYRHATNTVRCTRTGVARGPAPRRRLRPPCVQRPMCAQCAHGPSTPCPFLHAIPPAVVACRWFRSSTSAPRTLRAPCPAGAAHVQRS